MPRLPWHRRRSDARARTRRPVGDAALHAEEEFFDCVDSVDADDLVVASDAAHLTQAGIACDDDKERRPGLNTSLRRLDGPDSLNVQSAWSPLPSASVFRVRCGPQYIVNRRKLPALDPTLYDIVSVDMFSSPRKVLNLAQYMDLPKVPSGPEGIPGIFVVNFMLPLEKPSLTGNTGDGPTVCLNVVMKLSDWARANANHPSVELLARFVANCQEGSSMRERLKIIFQVCNREELDLSFAVGKMYDKYNGLPFLFRTYNSTYVNKDGVFIANFDAHKSGYGARLGRYGLLGIAHRIVCQCAFLVESQADAEMPERILGCFTVHRLRCLEATPMPPMGSSSVTDVSIGE